MTAFDPKSGKHSVAEVAFAIYFNGMLKPEAISKAKERRASYIEFLPGEGPVQGFQLNLGVGSPATPTSVAQIQDGFAWQRVKPDGTVGWRLAVLQDHVVVNCCEYTRWDEVWAIVGPWLVDMYLQITSGGHIATGFSLQIIDQFTRKQPVTSHILRQLFSDKSKFLPARFFENDELWHLYQGWFADVKSPLKGRQLNVINLSANRVGDSNVVTIDHLARVNLAPDSPALLPKSIEESPLEKLLNSLHNENKLTVSDLLTEEMVQAIGLID